MKSIEQVISELPAARGGQSLLQQFVPPRRFAGKRFSQYQPDAGHPSQEAALRRVEAFARAIPPAPADGAIERLRRLFTGRGRGGGIYLDGGFGVGKTHLLAALWNEAPAPKAYLSFDELVYAIGLLGVGAAAKAFGPFAFVAVDEWELDDPGNLKLAVAFMRSAVADGVRIAVTSNTIPDELGRGRFDQKRFANEIEELSSAFEVVRIEGPDYRQRRFRSEPGQAYFTSRESLMASPISPGGVRVHFRSLLAALRELHPIRYAGLVESCQEVQAFDVQPIVELPDALRWVHFIDKLYDATVPFRAAAEIELGTLFPVEFLTGPYGKKMGRCLSRMEEMLLEAAELSAAEPGTGREPATQPRLSRAPMAGARRPHG